MSWQLIYSFSVVRKKGDNEWLWGLAFFSWLIQRSLNDIIEKHKEPGLTDLINE